jgi:membrane-associated protease RseP (regulator of RpoE activity)
MEEEKGHATESPVKIPFSFTKNIWINILLFVVTIFTTFMVGIDQSVSYLHTEALVQGSQVPLNLETVMDPKVISLAIIYVVVLLGILLGHEFGHFLTCRYYRINATLPYFIPAPTLIGTLGAFIKIKSPITRKKQLFDIGVAGPLTGFILSIPALIYGLSLSKALPPSAAEEQFVLVFGEPLILKILGAMIFKNIPSDYNVFLHPVAFAGWVGILVTSFNLFPVGQLDGGHVSYSLLGEKARHVAGIFLGVFVIMGIFFWIGWFIWALILVFLGWRHPRIVDESVALSPRRKLLGYFMVVIFILSFITDPNKGYNLFEITRLFRF